MVDISQTSKYGDFSDDGREFVFTRFDTPRPWINYAWNENILISIDQRGRGQTLYRDSMGNRTVPIRDRFVFIKDVDSGEFWTVGWDPVQMNFDYYRCSHGLGYTVLRSDFKSIVCELTITASPKTPSEIWKFNIQNTGPSTRRIAIYFAVEFDLGGWTPYGTVENYSYCYLAGDKYLFAKNQSDERPGVRNHAWFASSEKPDHYETRKREFIGGPYAKLSSPAGVKSEILTDTEAANEEFMGIFQYNIDIPVAKTRTFFLGLGVSSDEREAKDFASRINAEEFNAGLAAAKMRTDTFDRVDFKLPNQTWTIFFNIWAKQQLSLLRYFTRVYLIGFRDTLQDALGLCAYDPETTRELISDTLSHQYNDGSAMRGWCPDDHHKYGDSGVWIPFAIGEWIRETGDFSILEDVVCYKNGGSGTIWEHQVKAMEWFSENLGEHGFPKLYFGDWNDSLNIGREGHGESVWLAMAWLAALKETAIIGEKIGDIGNYDKFISLAEDLGSNLLKHAWDGKWYLRGFADDGSSVGGLCDEQGSIFAEPQSWAVIAGLTPERWGLIVDSVNQFLRTPNGLKVCHPPYAGYQKRLGRISSMPVGWGENGSCYSHVTAFQAVADCIMRDGDSALRSLESITPLNPQASEEETWLEPYTFSNMFRGPENPRPRATFKGWTSGTVPWALRAMTHYILGIRPGFEGLVIDPVLPTDWGEVSVKRCFRGAIYEILIRKKVGEKVNRSTITVNGLPIDGNILPQIKAGETALVECKMT